MVRTHRRRKRSQGLTSLSALSPAAGGQFVVIGESLVDLVADVRPGRFSAHAGGSPFNVAIGLARLGHAVTFVTEYGEDPFGDVVDSHLRASGVRAVVHRRPTSLAIAAPDHDGSASYDFRFGWLLGRRDIAVAGGTACLHTGSLAAVVEPGRRAVLAAVRAARRAGIAVCVDPNIRPSFGADRRVVRAAIEELVEAATIVKASAEDIAWLYPDDDPVQRMRQWAAGSGRLAVLTTGADGCVGLVGSQVISVAANPVSVADTVGAGDSFTAALLANLAATDMLRVAPTLPADRVRGALEFAIRAATITCGRTGSYAPSIEDLR